ncbi:nuclear transport factor 2 family protein [Thermodesulfobacteriota bacterium]
MFLEKTINTFFEVMNSRNLKKMAELLDDDCEFYFPKTQPLIGKERILRFFNILFRQYPQLRFEVQRMIFQGNKAAIHWTNQGHNRRRESYENEGATIFEMADEKISFISDFFKSTDQW